MLDMNGWEPLQAYKRQTSHYSTLRNARSMDKQGKKFLVPGFIVSLYDRSPARTFAISVTIKGHRAGKPHSL